MSFPKIALALLCVAAAAQAQVDLNGLESAAARYTSHGAQGQPRPVDLDLRLIRGDSGNVPATLMAQAGDVQRWSIFYDISGGVGSGPGRPLSASLLCTRGQFSDYHTAGPAVPDCKSLEDTWVAVTLDSAIAQLNAQGYARGFTGVELRRPDLAGVPDGLVYIFNCPWERTFVAISGNTGALAWTQMY